MTMMDVEVRGKLEFGGHVHTVNPVSLVRCESPIHPKIGMAVGPLWRNYASRLLLKSNGHWVKRRLYLLFPRIILP